MAYQPLQERRATVIGEDIESDRLREARNLSLKKSDQGEVSVGIFRLLLNLRCPKATSTLHNPLRVAPHGTYL
jgi:hypothetical protein